MEMLKEQTHDACVPCRKKWNLLEVKKFLKLSKSFLANSCVENDDLSEHRKEVLDILVLEDYEKNKFKIVSVCMGSDFALERIEEYFAD